MCVYIYIYIYMYAHRCYGGGQIPSALLAEASRPREHGEAPTIRCASRYAHTYTPILYVSVCMSRYAMLYTWSPLEDSRLFGPSPWKILRPLSMNTWVPEQPSPWRTSSKRESCYGNQVYSIIIIIIILSLYYYHMIIVIIRLCVFY